MVLMLLLTGCDDKKEKHTLPPREIPQEPPAAPSPQVPPSQNLTKEVPAEENRTVPSLKPFFTLGSQDGTTHTVSIEENRLVFQDISQPIVILHFFATWSLPCQGEAPYLSDLQKKFPQKVFVAGILLHPDDHLQELETFIRENHADYFISSGSENDRFTQKIIDRLHMPEILPVPLTVIYNKGRYARHYEGAVPIEMVEHDIKVLLKK